MSQESRNTKSQACPVTLISNCEELGLDITWTFLFFFKRNLRGCMQRNTRTHKESHPSLDMRPAALPTPAFPGLAKETFLQAAEGLSATPGRGHTGSVVSPWCSSLPPRKVGQDTADPAHLCPMLTLQWMGQGLK